MKIATILSCLPLLFVTYTISCHKDNATETAVLGYTYKAPQKVDDGWEVSSASDAGMKLAKLVEMMNFIHKTKDHRIHGIVIIKDAKLVFEEYFAGFQFDTNDVDSEGPPIAYGRDTLHFMASVTKSITSVVFGIASDQGLLGGVDSKLAEYYPSFEDILIGQKSDITIKHLLSMTAGLAWDESSYSFSDYRNDVNGLFNNENPIKFILQKPLTSSPGSRFHYNSGYANVLADIVRLRSEVNAKEYAKLVLFDPLDIRNFRWDVLRGNYLFASGGLYLKPRDLAKVGQLFLNGGTWKGQRIISQEWINASIQNYIDPGMPYLSNGYGYQWWLNTFRVGSRTTDCFMAVGWGDQFMYVFPAENMVIVMTCGYFFVPATVTSHGIVQNYILPASLNLGR
jgi:CubicO group peptidase (beta-lactamase class C family)